ncbi:MAG TPA: ASKHA domain-containing protein, partial [bacterium]|nr:ASKHA domain-containing protein [bacterium]
VDLGTTTVVAKLIDLRTGRLLATESGLNRQRRHGEDVIARVGHANAHGVSILQREIVEQLNGMIGALAAQGGILREDIYEMVLAGNTVMEHLLLGVPPRHLAEMPYVPAVRNFAPVAAAEIGLALHPEARVVLFPVLGKFVGGDTAAVLLTLAGRLDGTWLAVDIGTNGEILLCHQGRIWTTSAAAGPAFEGAQISAGMRAAAGAIERVWWRGDHLEVRVIGGGEASGICGSGLIDAVAALLETGALDESGRLVSGHPLVTMAPHPGVVGLQPAARLTDRIVLTQRDIRELQLAKAAIATAIGLLLQSAGLRPGELEQLYLAGAFGQYIAPAAALRIGLLPLIDPEKIKFIGNAACAGAEMGLISLAERRAITELARRVEYVEVAAAPDFQDLFAENLLFGADAAD